MNFEEATPLEDLNEWGIPSETEADETITIEQIDDAVKAYAEAREDAEGKKKIREEAYKKEAALERDLISLLKRAKKTNYMVEGIGKIVVFDKYQVKNPSTPEERRKFFSWVEEHFGQDGLDKYQVTNSASINALYNNHREACEITGEDPTIDGLELPTATPNLRFTKTK